MSTQTHRARAHLSGEIRLPHAPVRVFPLLTPEGERSWVDGWDPGYPGRTTPSHDPGTAFLTHNHGQEAIWVVVEMDVEALRSAYACVIPGVRANLIQVRCHEAEDGGTLARVDYHVTSLSPEGDAVVQGFEGGYASMLEHWAEGMGQVLSGS